MAPHGAETCRSVPTNILNFQDSRGAKWLYSGATEELEERVGRIYELHIG
jgi:hypothetical protein